MDGLRIVSDLVVVDASSIGGSLCCEHGKPEASPTCPA